MVERPILFSAPMVRAILEGRKTQTRRIVKPGPPPREDGSESMYQYQDGWRYTDVDYPGEAAEYCRYGKPGDRLWVRETWAWLDWCMAGSYGYVPPEQPTYPPHYLHNGQRYTVQFRADYTERTAWGMTGPPRWRPSIHMPRSASRINLRITDVRAERLTDISEHDAVAEGWPHAGTGGVGVPLRDAYPIGWYANLWDDINGKGSYETNPWVWVVTFERASDSIGS